MARFAPFVHPSPPSSAFETLKTLTNTCTLLPFRVLYCVINMLFFACAARILLFFPTRLGHSLVDFIARVQLRLALLAMGFLWIRIRGASDPSAITIVSNHLSYFDMLLLCYLEMPSFVAKAGAKSVPFWGWCAEHVVNCIFSEQDKKKDSVEHATTEEIKRRQRQSSGRRLLVFPEGTTTNGRFLVQFRTGAFQAGAPVQPVLIEFAWRRHSPTWESIPVHVHLWRTLTQFTHHASVTYLPVYFPSVAERANPLLYAANVRKVMAEALRVPCAEVGRAEKSEYHSRITSGELDWRYWRNSPEKRAALLGL